jgi:hypothetical protein
MNTEYQSRVAGTIYDMGLHPWQQNINDLTDFHRKFDKGDGEAKKEAQAMISQNPLTPDEEIRRNMTTRKFPPRFGYRYTELTIKDILVENYQTEAEISEWNNFSGSQGEINSTARPSIW